jgi:hypothetical protein
VEKEVEPVACSDCFRDQGLRLDAKLVGLADSRTCPSCGSAAGRKLSASRLATLAYRFFVWGSLFRCEYGAAPLIQFNQHQKTSVSLPTWLQADGQLIERILGVGFFHYGPRLWMVGEVGPLKALQEQSTSQPIIKRILGEYPARLVYPEDIFYRVRKTPQVPARPSEYDSPPIGVRGNGRLDSPDSPVMYASPDLQVCVHECRVTAEDDIYVATLSSLRILRLLDLSALLAHEEATEFESLDMAVHMLFLAGSHSYPVARRIGLAIREAGYDGLVYPSYFSLLRNGVMPFETTYGISHRRVPSLQEYEHSKSVPNLAIFGSPIAEGRLEVRCINKLIINRVEYGVHFGPVGFRNNRQKTEENRGHP